MFENRTLKTIFEPGMDEVTGDWTKLHIEDFHNTGQHVKCYENETNQS
jgi:hypothetical protein